MYNSVYFYKSGSKYNNVFVLQYGGMIIDIIFSFKTEDKSL